MVVPIRRQDKVGVIHPNQVLFSIVVKPLKLINQIATVYVLKCLPSIINKWETYMSCIS